MVTFLLCNTRDSAHTCCNYWHLVGWAGISGEGISKSASLSEDICTASVRYCTACEILQQPCTVRYCSKQGSPAQMKRAVLPPAKPAAVKAVVVSSRYAIYRHLQIQCNSSFTLRSASCSASRRNMEIPLSAAADPFSATKRSRRPAPSRVLSVIIPQAVDWCVGDKACAKMPLSPQTMSHQPIID